LQTLVFEGRHSRKCTWRYNSPLLILFGRNETTKTNFDSHLLLNSSRVEKCGIPFATNVKSLLRDELGVDSRMGATFGKVYCGVVGGTDRHEYAVLGPSVNLAARLMANKQNHGFLVDECVKKQALRRKFHALQPIEAKGYTDLVPIFEPINQGTRRWKDAAAMHLFVGREKETNELIGLAENVIAHGSSKLVFITANSGIGKSATLARACSKVEELCKTNSTPHLIWGHVCSEDDLFRTFGYVNHADC
jgi:Adenylate and Guanylate cyclase catalytic domain